MAPENDLSDLLTFSLRQATSATAHGAARNLKNPHPHAFGTLERERRNSQPSYLLGRASEGD